MENYDEQNSYPPGARISVVLPGLLVSPFDYRAPDEGVRLGAVVMVPLGPRRVLGVVWGGGDGTFDAKKLRSIIEVVDVPPLQPELRKFLAKAAGYTLSPLPAMVQLALRAPRLGAAEVQRKLYIPTGMVPTRKTDARARVLDTFDAFQGAALGLSEVTREAGVSASVVKGLVKDGAIVEINEAKDAPFPPLRLSQREDTEARPLSPDQNAAVTTIRSVPLNQFDTVLLRGITGSGKTEVYLEALLEHLKLGRQVLILLPEIALTSAFVSRVEERFGARPGEWHSGVTQAERRRVWKMVSTGRCQIVVGARSALFLPFSNLGAIVIDEEHDGSYKQDDGVLYHARDMAVLRASISKAQVILTSATPSLETWVNAQSGKYREVILSQRFGAALLPQLRSIDMRAETLPGQSWISPTLKHAISDRIAKKEQSLIFLNRRGYAPVTLCRACGEQIGCKHCDARLVEHRFQNILMCHQCGETAPIPETCPSCGVMGKLAVLGPGVERIDEEVRGLFPDARIALLSSDRFGSARALKEAIAEIANGDIDIIIGTQIVAKGHNFPALTLVGVIDADLGLQGSDLRASEHTFQLLRQVSGRAGRGDQPGLALVQTYHPDHPVLQAILSGDDTAFWQSEARAREAAGMPPFGRLVAVIVTADTAQAAMEHAKTVAISAQKLQRFGIDVFGPAPAPIARIRGRHRVRLLIKFQKNSANQRVISDWASTLTMIKGITQRLDVDPISFL